MKTLRYLLIILGLASFLSVQAQGLTQMPSSSFRSTSAMMGSGSTLPTAVNTGVRVTGPKVGTYTPVTSYSSSNGPRRIGGSGSGTGGNEAEETTDPFEDPIGDAVWPLMLLACAYIGRRARRRIVAANMRQE